jgi:dienelactone hydrolase
MSGRLIRCFLIIVLISTVRSSFGAEPTAGDLMIARYFKAETDKLTQKTADRLATIKTAHDWKKLKPQLRSELFEMFGLDPLPEKTDLKPVITGRTDHAEFTVENLHFQSRPHLYVTGNLYLPKKIKGKAPAILYVCGHGRVKKNGTSYGNKTHYQHHGSWFARNGYICLIIDTLQLGEIEGIHHGTYRYGQWWWNGRGYSSSGVEAWNCIRALDYLQSRTEVDDNRIGVTGRSGGGAYTWSVAALDDRVKVAVAVAGITSLHNHVIDGTIEGHCDCMFHVNTYRWDYPLLAALTAPRPLLISNTDKDSIFPLDGVYDVFTKIRPLYNIHQVPRKLGLNIAEGPHKDTQELRVHAFHWLNKFLKNQDPSPLIEMVATKLFQPEQLRVFKKLPADEINTKIQEHFTLKAQTPPIPKTSQEWNQIQKRLKDQLEQKSFRGWPEKPAPLNLRKVVDVSKKGIQFQQYHFQSELFIDLDLYVLSREGLKPSELDLVVLNGIDQTDWDEFIATMKIGFPDQFDQPGNNLDNLKANQNDFEQFQKMFKSFKWGMAYIAPRGIGPTAFTDKERKRTHIRRRFMQWGQTQDSMQTWDIRRAIQALRSISGMKEIPLWLQGKRAMAGNVLYASLFEPNITRLDLWELPKSHREGPTYLNVLRVLDTPQAIAMAGSRSRIRIYQDQPEGWKFPKKIAKALNWDKKQFQIRVMKSD